MAATAISHSFLSEIYAYLPVLQRAQDEKRKPLDRISFIKIQARIYRVFV